MGVVITGIGTRSPLGCTLQECFENLRLGTRCVQDIENFKTDGFVQRAAGEVRRNGEVVKTPSGVDRKALFLEESVKDLSDSTYFRQRYNPEEIVLNTGGGLDYVDIETFFKKGEFRTPAGGELPSHFKSGELIKEIAAKFNISGGTNIFMAACAASSQAIGTSFRMVSRGITKAAVTGGSDSMINYINYVGFQKLGAMTEDTNSPYACKPFDLRRSGTVLGEGALVMLLEESSNARSEDIFAEIKGYATSMDSYAVTDPDPEGGALADAINRALADAEITPHMIDCVHLHGTGTPKNAPAEYAALSKVFGDRVHSLPVYSMKGQIGHLIGSCGAMEMLGAIYSLKNQVVLPTINYNEKDPKAPLYVIKDEPLKMSIKYLLKTNSSFGGENSAIVLKKWEK